jgi:O-antigen ligase
MPAKALRWLADYPNRFGILLMALLPAMLFSEFFTSLFILFIFVNFFFHHFWKDLGFLIKQPMLLIMLAFFLIQVLGYYLTPEPMRDLALRKMETKLPFVLVPLFFAGGFARLDTRWTHRLLHGVVWTNVAAALFCYGYAAWQVYNSGRWHSTWSDGSVRDYYFLYAGLSDVLMHPGYLATFAGGGLMTAVWLLVQKPKPWVVRLGLRLAIGVLGIFILMLQARINILGLLLISGIAAAVVIFGMPKFRKPFLRLAAFVGLLLALAVLIPSPLSKRFSGLTNFEYRLEAPTMDDFTGITIRLAEWTCAREAIQRHGFWGSGQGAAQEALQEVYRERNFIMGMEQNFNAHNQFYETRLANGVPGLLILIALFGWAIWIGIRQRNGLLLGFAVYWVIIMLAESMLERQKGVILCCIYLPLFYQWGRARLSALKPTF